MRKKTNNKTQKTVIKRKVADYSTPDIEVIKTAMSKSLTIAKVKEKVTNKLMNILYLKKDSKKGFRILDNVNRAYFIEECYNMNKNTHIFIDNDLCYYNKIGV